VAVMGPLTGLLIQRLRIRRITAAIVVGVAVWLLGLLVALSFAANGSYAGLENGALFRWLGRITAECLLPLVALLTAVLVGWRMRPEILRRELYRELDLFFSLWRRLLRYIAPLAILIYMLASGWSRG
jgi:NSS family neurotransmitter:Na+ symporter